RWQLANPERGLGAASLGGLVEIESSWDISVLASLASRGHRLAPVEDFSRIGFGMGQVILRDPDTGVLIAGSEPRSDGCAVGW
ncbi:MAG: gamma-glutamyltransferase, partial [Candidatus Promineifilaceae bacterium]